MRRYVPPTPAQEQAFLSAVMYASVFDYPLTLEQLQQTLVGERAGKEDLVAWYAASEKLQAAVETRDGYFFPRGRGDFLERRHEREVVSRQLLEQLATPLSLVLGMPFVRMVALSGSLAHRNADRGADLDLFVVTSANRTWSVITTLIVLTRVMGWRRRLCINYIVSERSLSVEPRDLFSANQIVHLRPLCGTDTYRAFLEANPFIRRYYPNFHWSSAGAATESPRRRRIVERLLDLTIAPIYERACRLIVRVASAATRLDLAIARSRAARARVPQAAHEQPSSARDGAIRECARRSRSPHTRSSRPRAGCPVTDRMACA